MTSTTPETARGTSQRMERAGAVIAASAAAVAVWAVADPLIGLTLEVKPWNSTTTTIVGPAHVIISAALAALAGWGLLAVLEKTTPRAGRIWTVIAVAVLILSLSGPAMSSADASTAVTLILMHLAVGGVLIPTLPRR